MDISGKMSSDLPNMKEEQQIRNLKQVKLKPESTSWLHKFGVSDPKLRKSELIIFYSLIHIKHFVYETKGVTAEFSVSLLQNCNIILKVINHLSLSRWRTDPSHLLCNLRPEGLWEQFLARRSPVKLLPLMLCHIFAFIYLLNSRRKPQWRWLSLCATLIIIQKAAKSQVTC